MEHARAASPVRQTARAMLRGLMLRCPRCTRGRMPRSLFGIGGTCPVCGLPFELGAGDFSGAIMIAQMLLGLLVIPVWILLSVIADLSFTTQVVVTTVLLFGLLIVFYRNIKGMWYGFLYAADRVESATGPAEG